MGGVTGMQDRFETSFQSTELQAREAIRATIDRLHKAGLNDDRAGEVEIALSEAVNNVVEHAYADGDPGMIRILCSMRVQRLDIRIADTGQPMPMERLPPGLAADLSVPRAELPEGGFGWFLIRQLTSEIRYDRCNGHNHLSLRFDL